MFGRQRRAQQRAIERLRTDLAAERRARDCQLAALQAALVDAVERARDEQHCEVHRLRMSIEQYSSAIGALLEQVAHTYGALVDSSDIARADRVTLAEALEQLVQGIESRTVAPTSYRRPLPEQGVLDLTAEEHDHARGIGTEVWCRFENRWIGGFEIADTVNNGRDQQYRLRRTTDGYVLPTLFSHADVRIAKRVL